MCIETHSTHADKLFLSTKGLYSLLGRERHLFQSCAHCLVLSDEKACFSPSLKGVLPKDVTHLFDGAFAVDIRVASSSG